MTFYNKHIDCGRLYSDFYDNTPHVSEVRNHTPTFIQLRWGDDLDPSCAVVEFHNYYSILPVQQARTFTTRGSFGIYPQTSPEMQLPISKIVAVPHGAVRFRIRLHRDGPLVSNFVPVRGNATYYYEAGKLFEFYAF